MMERYSIAALRSYCDQVAGQGKELAVAWTGGSDEGWFTLHIDNKEVINPEGVEQQLLNFIEDQLEYGGFDGDFSTDGRITYNASHSAFTGTDDYSDTESVSMACEVVVSVPVELYFDKLRLHLSSDGDYHIQSHLELVILNGPVSELFEQISPVIECQLSADLNELIADEDEFAGMWEDYDLIRNDFELAGNTLSYTIRSLEYSRNHYDPRSIYIELK